MFLPPKSEYCLRHKVTNISFSQAVTDYFEFIIFNHIIIYINSHNMRKRTFNNLLKM